jgi:hypothetical protein
MRDGFGLMALLMILGTQEAWKLSRREDLANASQNRRIARADSCMMVAHCSSATRIEDEMR